MGDKNAKQGNESVDQVVGKWEIYGQNENGEWLVKSVMNDGCF